MFAICYSLLQLHPVERPCSDGDEDDIEREKDEDIRCEGERGDADDDTAQSVNGVCAGIDKRQHS